MLIKCRAFGHDVKFRFYIKKVRILHKEEEEIRTVQTFKKRRPKRHSKDLCISSEYLKDIPRILKDIPSVPGIFVE